VTFLEARGDFDRWVEHPGGGADPALIAKDLRGRQNHILSRAFDDLDDDEKALLGSIAMANLNLTMEILRLLNPKRPLEPARVAPPENWTEEELYFRTSDRAIDNAYHAWTNAKSADERAAAQATLDELRERNLAERRRDYESRVADHLAWQRVAEAADAWLDRTLPKLELRALLHFDADTGSLDMHPAIRHTVLIGLSPDARSSTGSHVSDALSARPAKPFDEARTLDDLAIAMTRVEALNAAGKLKEGWDLYRSSGLDNALFRLQYAHEQLELLQPYFPQGWEQGPILLPEDVQADALVDTADGLDDAGKSDLACTLYARAIRIRLANKRATAASLGNLAISLNRQGQPSRADRLASLALRLAEADGNRDDVLWLKANQAEDHIRHGRFDEAGAALVTLRTAIAEQKVSSANESQVLTCGLLLAFRTGCLSEQVAADCVIRIRGFGQRFDERRSLFVVAVWHQSCGRHDDALDVYGDLIALANEIGSPSLPRYEARRALSLAACGRHEEARRVAAKVDHGKDPPHVALALLYLALGDQAKARAHALAGYQQAWGEGPPYHDHWDLEDCRKVLTAVGEAEPVLPPFDPSKVEPFDFEPDVERLIETKLAEKAKAAEERAKRDGAREAEAAKSANPPKPSS
jgi:hypothetical protein